VTFGGCFRVWREFDDGRRDVEAAYGHGKDKLDDGLAIAESHLSLKFLFFFYIFGAIGQFEVGLIGGVVAHWNWQIGRVLLLPFVVFHYLVDVGLAQYLDVVPCLLDVKPVEAFDDAKFIKWIDHVVLDLLDLETELHGLCSNDEVVGLS
jgi:hypothetical protein